jgi:hypothetical protein
MAWLKFVVIFDYSVTVRDFVRCLAKFHAGKKEVRKWSCARYLILIGIFGKIKMIIIIIVIITLLYNYSVDFELI